MKEPQKALAGSRARLTLVKPEYIHITLKFLGEIDEKTCGRVASALKALTFSPFDISVAGVRGNPPSSPRVIWSGIRDGGGCGRLFALVEEALSPLGIPKEKRPYTPHATIARVKRFDSSLLPVLRNLAALDFGSCTVSCLKLKRSTLTPEGPIYDDMAEVRCA